MVITRLQAPLLYSFFVQVDCVEKHQGVHFHSCVYEKSLKNVCFFFQLSVEWERQTNCSVGQIEYTTLFEY